MPFLTDSHAHLNFPAFKDDLHEVLNRAREACVQRIINIGAGLGLEGNNQTLSIANAHANIFATVGFHPHEAKNWSPEVADEIVRLANEDRVVGIGEIGLDFAKLHSPRELQIKAFQDQLKLARELEMPFVIHDRDAHGEMMRILRQHGAPFRAVMHCYSGSLDMARELIHMGFYISIPGTLTFKNARALPELVKALPLESLLIETDCPFLAPEPFRGKRNEPAHVRYVACKVAELKRLPLDEVASVTTRNVEKLFRLPPLAEIKE
jgi:TatD DNase family protein